MDVETTQSIEDDLPRNDTHSVEASMNTNRIDFISSYCDSWCDRCAFTMRCSTFAWDAATAMCGDRREGFELAFGWPKPVDDTEDARSERPVPAAFLQPSAHERAAIVSRERARDRRIASTRLSADAHDYATASHRWLITQFEPLRAAADAVLVEALDVVKHDSILIAVKVHRALSSRDRRQHDHDVDDHPLRHNCNGSAKVALIVIERSEVSWRVIARATGDDGACTMADSLRDLQRLIHEEFPHAMSFVRPGFDEPWS